MKGARDLHDIETYKQMILQLDGMLVKLTTMRQDENVRQAHESLSDAREFIQINLEAAQRRVEAALRTA